MLSLVIRELEEIEGGDPEFLRYRYKNYGIGWYDKYVGEQYSTRIYNRVCAVPIKLEEGKYVVDREKTNKVNAWVICPVGCRIQTYNVGMKWDITPISDQHRVYLESTEQEKEALLTDTIRRILSYIDLN